jgi:hypothetical protein
VEEESVSYQAEENCRVPAPPRQTLARSPVFDNAQMEHAYL